ncbi:hypothetical protein Pla110_37590 [Polystyrenella longa]|uniref:Cell division protein FtsQ n=1 Tax=Polystyrenella longa TaxID=2528007 RepID=A0A518CS01_9PLAN|nr:hypothetical protein [Polystyrenella longa]QDU82007.1 hypothetical protein Pla110_37590 [Polystyrenella longa]
MLFAKQKKKPGKRKQKEKPKQQNWFTRNLFRPFPLLWLALIATLIVLAPRVYKKLPDLTSQHRYQLTSSDITLENRPDWVPAHFLNAVLSHNQIPDNVLEPELARTISTWFEKEPWVKSVEAVRIGYPPSASVELTFREPVAVVELEGKLHPIDVDSVILPSEDFAPATLERFPVLHPSKVPPPLYVGSAWDDPVIRKGAKLASEIKPYWGNFDFVAIRAQQDQRNRAATGQGEFDPTFEIVSASGSIIVWGRAPESTHPGELTFDEKVRRLMAYQKRFEGFALPSGPYEIDITHWTDISRRVLKEAAAETDARLRR